jgi:molybdenum cofactor biosynthesis enzyme MoaA
VAEETNESEHQKETTEEVIEISKHFEKEAAEDAVEEPKSESNTSAKVYRTEQEKDEIEKARPSYCKFCRSCEKGSPFFLGHFLLEIPRL